MALKRLREKREVEQNAEGDWILAVNAPAAAAASPDASRPASKPPKSAPRAHHSDDVAVADEPRRAALAMAVEVEGATSVTVQLTPRMRARLEAFVAVGPRGMSIDAAAQLFLEAAFSKDAA
jgi:hypothetical protein